MITVTQTAADKITGILAGSDNAEKSMLRIQIEGYGWGGPKFKLTLDELKGQNDKVLDTNGIAIIYNKDIEEYLDNMVLDYEESSLNRGFTIKGSSSSCC